jgi:hypothetical protein
MRPEQFERWWHDGRRMNFAAGTASKLPAESSG